MLGSRSGSHTHQWTADLNTAVFTSVGRLQTAHLALVGLVRRASARTHVGSLGVHARLVSFSYGGGIGGIVAPSGKPSAEPIATSLAGLAHLRGADCTDRCAA